VCGIAQLGEEIFIASESSSSIAVFVFQGRQDFTRQDDISFNELTAPPQDIAASGELQQLFVADRSGRCVWQLARSSQGHWEVKSRALSGIDPESLSVNGKQLLVVEKRRLIKFRIAANKTELRLKLPEEFEAEHALETTDATFIVCGQRGKVPGVKKPGIMQVSQSARVLRECDPQYFGSPCYLSPFDNIRGDLLVVDNHTQCVVVLNSLLAVVRVFLDKDHDDVVRPRRVIRSEHILVGCASSSDDSRGIVSLYWPQKSTLQELPDQ